MSSQTKEQTNNLAEIVGLIEVKNWKQAQEKIEGCRNHPLYHNYKGLIYYLQEDYSAAVVELRMGQEVSQNSHWLELLQQAEEKPAEFTRPI